MVFISYHRRDRPIARRVAAALSEGGFDYWLDVERLDLATDVAPQLHAALAACHCVVHIEPRMGPISEWVVFELERAQSLGIPVWRLTDDHIRRVPVRTSVAPRGSMGGW